MNDRRSFIKQAGLLSGATLLSNALPEVIQKAMAINPNPGTTFEDAEHIVFLMQENRSFDHMFGALKGVRGFNDPRPYQMPNKDKVWIQRDEKGNAYTPFHIDLNKTKVTWQGGLPHSWPDQIAAYNKGKYNNWIPKKTVMTMAHYKREDLPFYYALADAFTICDHYFCSSLTGTTPNRLFFWTGNVRKSPNNLKDRATVYNSQAESHSNTFVDYPSFPALLEDNNVSWRVYQNELWTAKLKGEVDDWCGNYGDNALEYVSKHRVKLAAYFRKNGNASANPKLSAQEVLAQYNKLSQNEKNLIDKAFTTNEGAEDYLDLAPFTFKNEKGEEETINVPKGDIFYQFRKDVNEGKLPTVSWLVAPQRFSDHTSSPLYGTWYVSEALNILIQNPEVWKKTIFIINYDENDGYFDHIVPFTAPRPNDISSGKVSEGINTASDFDEKDNSPIGLGYRVPMIIASPWSRGGFVNSQILDHTSTLMFLENYLKKKKGISIESPQISTWRRAICGDLTSAFRPYEGGSVKSPKALIRNEVIQHIQSVKSKPRQLRPHPLSEEEVRKINAFHAFEKSASQVASSQESGIKQANALPYDFFVDANLSKDKAKVNIDFQVSENSVGVPFRVQALNTYREQKGQNWNFAVKSNDSLQDDWAVAAFESGKYDLAVYGPNGFYRRFKGNKNNPDLIIKCSSERNSKTMKNTGNLIFEFENTGHKSLTINVKDEVYRMKVNPVLLHSKKKHTALVKLKKSNQWYDFNITVLGFDDFMQHFAGHIETETESFTDSYMGNLLSNKH